MNWPGLALIAWGVAALVAWLVLFAPVAVVEAEADFGAAAPDTLVGNGGCVFEAAAATICAAVGCVVAGVAEAFAALGVDVAFAGAA